MFHRKPIMHPHDLVQDLIAYRDAQQQLLKVMNRTIQTAHSVAEAIDATFAELRERLTSIENAATSAELRDSVPVSENDRLLFP